MFAVRADPKNKAFLRLLKELPARFAAAERLLAFSMADETRRQVLRRLPSDADYNVLRDSLEVVRGNSSHSIVYAVRSRPTLCNVSKLDAKKDVVYVNPKRVAATVPDEIRVLEAFNPWPVDMLPFAPDPRYAVLVHRKVSVREVERLRKMRTADRPRWMRMLAKAGAGGKEPDRPDLSQQRSVPDSVFQSLNLEFGLGSHASPHWRPAVRDVKKPAFVKKVVGSPKFRRTLADPLFRQWRSWATSLGSDVVSLSEIAKYRGFEDKLGIT